MFRSAEDGRDGKRAGASITVYLSLMLIIVLALICTLIESGRMSAVTMRVRSLAYMSADSVFAEFAQPVFSDYGIMVLWKSESEFISEFEEYVNGSLDVSDISYSANADLMGISLTGSWLNSSEMITDDSGLVFAQQVYDYMSYYLAETAAQELLDGLDIFTQSDTVSSFMETVSSVSDVFTAVEDAVSEIKEAIETAKSTLSNPSELLEELYYEAGLYSADNDTSAAFASALTELKNMKSQLLSSLEEIEEQTQAYYECAQEAQKAAEELEESLALDGGDLDEEVYEALQEQIDELKEKSADTDADYYEVAANEEVLEELISKAESLENLFSSLDDTLTEENAQEYMEAIAQYQELFEDFDLDSLGVNFDTEETASESSSVLSFISGLIDKGVLAYVKEDISENTVETDEFPSADASADEDEDESLSEATLNKVIFGEYVLEHFGNAVSAKDDTALEYEVEYIIAGKSSDLENLKVVTGELVALRSGMNFISLLKDSEKVSQAQTLAAAMVGFTGMPLLTKVFELLIMTAWASAEAIVDVKALLEGEKVPAIKSSSEWSLSIDGFKDFNGKNLETVSCSDGLEYADYLRILLAASDSQTQYFRTMDMIQADMCLNENESFRMADCMTGAEICVSFSASQLFTAIPLVMNQIDSSGGNYSFTILQSCGY